MYYTLLVRRNITVSTTLATIYHTLRQDKLNSQFIISISRACGPSLLRLKDLCASGQDRLGPAHLLKHSRGGAQSIAYLLYFIWNLKNFGKIWKSMLAVAINCDFSLPRLIIGNINDRSLLGERYSEMAVIVEDQDLVSTKAYSGCVRHDSYELFFGWQVDCQMNGEPCKVGRFCHSLRCHLFRWDCTSAIILHIIISQQNSDSVQGTSWAIRTAGKLNVAILYGAVI